MIQTTTNTERVINFWQKIDTHFPNPRITNWIVELEEGKSDWFRNYGLLNITLAGQCSFGRIRFDEEKYAKLQKWATGILNHYGLQVGMMQN